MCQSSCHYNRCCHSCCCSGHCYHVVNNTGCTFNITPTTYRCCRCQHTYTVPYNQQWVTNPGVTWYNGSTITFDSSGVAGGVSGNIINSDIPKSTVRKCDCGPHAGCSTGDGTTCECQCSSDEVCSQCYETCFCKPGYTCPKCNQ